MKGVVGESIPEVRRFNSKTASRRSAASLARSLGPYYHNYASTTGLMAGAVFGRIAGRNGGPVKRD
jgi:hypothetical protein